MKWSVLGYKENGSEIYFVIDEKNTHIALTSGEFGEVTARLISAAPDLLEACKSAILELCMSATSGPSPMTAVIVDKLNAAIKKAEAECPTP